MRIVVWNCNMALHRKYDALLALEPDIAVIPECANTKLLEQNAPKLKPRSMVWVGDNPHKGFGVFTFKTFSAIEQPIYRAEIPYIVPIRIIGPTSFNLLGVWACHSKPNSYEADYGPLGRALRHYREFISENPSVVAGDFNNNVLWDRADRIDKHAKHVDELTKLGLRSAYHFSRSVEQGNEPEPTIYWRDRKRDGPRYHIDYCFVPTEWTRSNITVKIGGFDDWVGKRLSDHVPLIVDVDP